MDSNSNEVHIAWDDNPDSSFCGLDLIGSTWYNNLVTCSKCAEIARLILEFEQYEPQEATQLIINAYRR